MAITQPANTTASCVEKVNVIVRGKSENPTKMTVQAGKFKLVIDEPEQMGGTNEGPSPIQVLLMALAGCLNVTGHHVARERSIPLKGMKVKIEGVMNPCTFIGCSFEERPGFKQVKVTVTPEFEGEVSDEEVTAWLQETESRCPVTDNIRAGTHISIARG